VVDHPDRDPHHPRHRVPDPPSLTENASVGAGRETGAVRKSNGQWRAIHEGDLPTLVRAFEQLESGEWPDMSIGMQVWAPVFEGVPLVMEVTVHQTDGDRGVRYELRRSEVEILARAPHPWAVRFAQVLEAHP
jgi:hypothetical protein